MGEGTASRPAAQVQQEQQAANAAMTGQTAPAPAAPQPTTPVAETTAAPPTANCQPAVNCQPPTANPSAPSTGDRALARWRSSSAAYRSSSRCSCSCWPEPCSAASGSAPSQGKSLRGKAVAQQVEEVDVSARRGTITDRNGLELAVSEDSSSVYANPFLIKDPASVAGQLSPLTGLDYDTLDPQAREPQAGLRLPEAQDRRRQGHARSRS